MFTTPCFIRKNTKELRDKLSLITGTDRWLFSLRNGYGKYIVHNKVNDTSIDCINSSECDFIDCGENEELFLAIAALRDDSDYMQWLTCAEVPEFTLCRNNSIDEHFMYSCPNELHGKATIEELIEHFKGK